MKQAQFKTTCTLICPSCGEDSQCSVDHLMESAKPGKPYPFGAWSCRVCKMGIKGIVRVNNGQTFVDVEAAPKDESHPPVMSLLVIPPQSEPIYLLKNDSGYIRPGEGRDVALDRHYYFNSHSCPTNWMNNFETIQIGDDADPHGMIRFVRAIHKDEFDAIEEKIREKWGMSPGSSTDEMDREIMETAFPEVAARFIPTGDIFGENSEPDTFEQSMQEVFDVPEQPITPAYASNYDYYGKIRYTLNLPYSETAVTRFTKGM